MLLNKEIFRANDIRGIVDKTLNNETVELIGQAIGNLITNTGNNSIIVARDGRLSSPQLANALIKGLISADCNVTDLGATPTPIMYFACHHLGISSGIIITGSHNPKDYNGLKIVINNQALYGDQIQNIYQNIINKNIKIGNNNGSILNYNIIHEYINKITNDIKLDRKLKIVLDCGNGIPGIIAPSLFDQLKCEVITLFCEVDGNFPNHHPDPGNPNNLVDLIHAVKEHNADLGIAFDGDGDRLGIIDSNGKLIFPDRLMMLFAQHLLPKYTGNLENTNLEPKKKPNIVYDIKCSRDLAKIIKESNGTPVMWKTGHAFIKAKMKETNAILAGEMSGHIYFKDRWYGFDDAIYSAARLLEILSEYSMSTAEIFAQLPEKYVTPEININVTEASKFNIIEKLIANIDFKDIKNISLLDGIRVEFEDGWGLIRASNTTPKLVARFEANSIHALDRIKNNFKTKLREIMEEPELVF